MMTYSRKYDFQSGTRISSSQVDDEFNQLIAAANALESANNSTNSKAQMMKITSDLGDAKLRISDTSKDLLAELMALGSGLHSFYAVSGTKNLPPSGKSVRGLFHQTTSGYGWAFAFDYENKFYRNYLNNGVWDGWKPDGFNTQDTLWTGASYLRADQTQTISKKLSECRNGWILIWSDYDPGTGANDYDLVCSVIAKGSGFTNGFQHMFVVPNYESASSATFVNKKIRVFDNRLEGFDDNESSTTGSNDVVLRKVLEW